MKFGFLKRLLPLSREERLKILETGRRSARSEIFDDGWWFSEDPITQKAIQDLTNGRRIIEVREEWRAARLEAKRITDAREVEACRLRDLVKRAVSHPVGWEAGQPRWSAVGAIFSVGSTSAHQLCRQFGLNPNEMQERAEDARGEGSCG